MMCTQGEAGDAEAPGSTGSADYAIERIDTCFAPDAPTDYWIDHVRSNHGSLQLHFEDPPVFRGSKLVQKSATHQLVDFRSDALHYVRTDADANTDDQVGSFLIIARDGVLEVEQNGVQMRLQPGQAALVTKSRALQLRHGSGARGFTFEARDVECPVALQRHPTVVDLRNGLGSVVFAMLSTVSQQHRSLGSYEFTRSCTTLGELLAACLLERRGLPDTLESVERAVREYVAHHASDPDLTLRTIAGSLGWSVRQIQLALQHAGTTTSDLIRATRVNRAAELLHHSPPATTIGRIAFESGFRSTSTFDVVFKQYFGLTPREARALRRNAEATNNP
jgi:AraC-like DNA-binding protein